ncbi:hypothetical protein DERF_007026 [Dermatophagoides farinae]|uniref:Uncharacterized protein n=1 Tax=Dermatophagoides farinae TaxID=6954 RepID=A0A922HY87_DERFA|nr:hypothetical protein DERF_007026 [Dermatophagoides farinae]
MYFRLINCFADIQTFGIANIWITLTSELIVEYISSYGALLKSNKITQENCALISKLTRCVYVYQRNFTWKQKTYSFAILIIVFDLSITEYNSLQNKIYQARIADPAGKYHRFYILLLTR